MIKLAKNISIALIITMMLAILPMMTTVVIAQEEETNGDNQGLVTVKYLDSYGKELAESIVVTNTVGEEFDSKKYEENIDGYTCFYTHPPYLVFDVKPQSVTYYYRLTMISEPIIMTVGEQLIFEVINPIHIMEDYKSGVWVEENYDKEIAEITEYSFKDLLGENDKISLVELKANQVGEMYIVLFIPMESEGQRMMNQSDYFGDFDYTQNPNYFGKVLIKVIPEKEEIKTGSLEIRYIDDADDTDIIKPIVRTGEIGTQWKIQEDEFKEFDGYVKSMVDHNDFGKFTEEKQIVRFWYKKVVEIPKPDKPADTKPIPTESVETKSATKNLVPKTGINDGTFFYVMAVVNSLIGLIILKNKTFKL